MKPSKFTEEQIAVALHQHEAGSSVGEVIRKLGISEQTFYRWKKKFGGLAPSEVRRLKQLEEENRRLKQRAADLSLDRHMLQEVRGGSVSLNSLRAVDKWLSALVMPLPGLAWAG